MHAPRPYGLFVDGGELTERDKTFISHQMRKLTNAIQTEEVTSYRHQYELPDGGYVIVQDMGGIFKAIARKPDIRPAKLVLDGFAKLYVPMLFSGVITKAVVRTDDGKTGIRLSEATRLRIAGYRSQQTNLPTEDQNLARFFIPYATKFQYFKPGDTGIFTHTQYAKQRPTWYSGAMCEVMQIVGGYGRQVINDLPEDRVERATLKLPDDTVLKAAEKLTGVRLPAYTGFPDAEGQFQYDYKFDECHAVGFDDKNEPWLMVIGRIGAYAMPLPLIPVTTTQAFRDYIESINDEEILKILDRFGGMPSGESFPKYGSDFQAWLRAGVIVKLCDTLEFYQKQPMYYASGWSFNTNGSRGFNTCWQYQDNGLMRCYAYTLAITLKSAVDAGRLKTTWSFASSAETGAVNNYLDGLFKLLPDDGARTLAIRYKIGRQNSEQILNRAIANPVMGKQEVLYWENLELNPIASHSAKLSLTSNGNVYWPGKNPKAMGRLKFPELTGQGCESFVMNSPEYTGDFVRCDTIMFGAYIGDDLQVVRYFIDDRKFNKKIESTFEDVMIVGEWEKTETTGATGLMGYFYTSSFDDRQEAPEVTTHTKIIGSDLGYSTPEYRTPSLFMMEGTLSRARYYKHITQIEATSGFSIDVGICIPSLSRDAILYAYTQSTSGEYSKEQQQRKAMQDPTSYRLWCYDSIFHYQGYDAPYLGEPRSKEGTPVYVDRRLYNPTENSDFADSGNWFGYSGGAIDVTGVCGPYTSRFSSHAAAGVVIGGDAPQIIEYTTENTLAGKNAGKVCISMQGTQTTPIHKSVPQEFYFIFSPVDSGGVALYFQRDACRVVFGDSEYANISNEGGIYGRRKFWGYTKLADHKSAHHFIGVINE